MQDEINEKSVALGARIGELTATELKKVADRLLDELQGGKLNPFGKGGDIRHGRQTMRELAAQNAGLSSIELKDPNLRLLKRTMDRNGVDFAIAKDGKGRYTLFFKGRDADALTHALSRYTEKVTERAAGPDRPSITSTLAAMKQAARELAADIGKVKDRDRGAPGL